MAFEEDLSGFFDVPQGFAVQATWSAGPPVRGIFDNAFALSGGEIEGTAPAFLCATDDIPEVAHGQTLTIDEVVYTIVGIEPELGGGTTILRLRAA